MTDQVPLLVYHTDCGVPYVLRMYKSKTGKCWWTPNVTNTLVDYYIDNPTEWPGSEQFDNSDWANVLRKIKDDLIQQNRFTPDQLMLVVD